jgi:nucleotide-binding universal stress UspA family protein
MEGEAAMNTENQLPLETILVITDVTHSGSCALRYAKRIAELHGSKLVVVHAIDPAGYAFPKGVPESLADDQRALQVLEQIEKEIKEQGIQIHSILESEVIYERILETARDHHADLIVLDTRAIARIGSSALGTVARRLLAAAPCPILTVPPAAGSNFESTGRWRHVLVATDFSPASLRALHHAQSIVSRLLVVLHVADDPANDHEHYLEDLRYLAPLNESHTVPVEHIVRSGEPGEVIAEQAGFFAADLVVLGSPLDELQDEQVQTSTVLQVISNVRCPVLCVPSVQNPAVAEVVDEIVYSI